ncbi:hypothetical protein DWB78_15605 [Halopelagius longus]|uniref:Uncharacterized protein n=1 Tax=Halopelagius longus TaxID=1236180 RepID=A0A370IKL6_9EURY|nr:hypothetical protein DWB78_15605 [Halopelagius longus]
MYRTDGGSRQNNWATRTARRRSRFETGTTAAAADRATERRCGTPSYVYGAENVRTTLSKFYGVFRA